MIPVLRAEENLLAVTVHAAGAGLMKKHDRDWVLFGWRRDARMGLGEDRPRQRTLADLTGNGLGIRWPNDGASAQQSSN